MNITIDKEVIRGLNIDYLKAMSLNPDDWHEAGQSEYKLYAHLSTLFQGTTILDVGSRTGGSALALSYNEENQVISYDLREQGASTIKKNNITWKIQDFRDDDTLDYDNISIIMIDVDPHDGTQEEEMFEFLDKKRWKGLVLLDDIGPQWPEIEDFWNRITFPKLDVSDVGHMSGTGAVSFDSKHELSWKS
jgi:cyclopropane fatty-acyl-phospholipid synthase-like methyltransferase